MKTYEITLTVYAESSLEIENVVENVRQYLSFMPDVTATDIEYACELKEEQ